MGSTVEKIKDRLSVHDVLSSYLKLEKAGINYKAKCPFHSEKTPSFFVSPARGTFYCFGCGAKGDIFSFVEKFEGLDFRGALALLARRAGVEVERERPGERDKKEALFDVLERAAKFFEERYRETESVRAYLLSRGLTEKTITAFRIGYAPAKWRDLSETLIAEGIPSNVLEEAGLAKRSEKETRFYDRFRGRIMFPLFDPSGRVIAFSGRIFPPDEAAGKEIVGEAKYQNSPETPVFHKSKFLYGYNFAKEGMRKLGFSIVVEGQMDLLSCHQAGYRNAVALSGTALSAEQVELLKRLSEKILLAFDSDEAGMAAAFKSALLAISRGMDAKILLCEGGKDPSDILREDPVRFKNALKNAKHAVEFFLDAVLAKGFPARKMKQESLHFLLPLLLAISSPVDRSHFLSLSAKRLSVSSEALSEELSLFEARANTSLEKTSISSSPISEKPRTSLKEKIIHEALGLLLIAKGELFREFDVSEFETQFRSLVGTADEVSPEAVEEAAFHIEERCGTLSSLHKEARELLLRLTREILQESLETVSEKIRTTESEGGDTTEETRAYNTLLQQKRDIEMRLAENGTELSR